MSASALIEAVEAEGFGRGDVVAAAFGDVQVAGVFEGRDDGGADGGQVTGGGVGAGQSRPRPRPLTGRRLAPVPAGRPPGPDRHDAGRPGGARARARRSRRSRTTRIVFSSAGPDFRDLHDRVACPPISAVRFRP
jgi:hypothetical protein